jgi:hypothetical protein
LIVISKSGFDNRFGEIRAIADGYNTSGVDLRVASVVVALDMNHVDSIGHYKITCYVIYHSTRFDKQHDVGGCYVPPGF